MNRDVPPIVPQRSNEISPINNTEVIDNGDNNLLDKKDKYIRVLLTDEEKNMSGKELALKYNLGRFGLTETRKRGYVVLNSNKSEIRNNEILDTEDNDRFIHIPLLEEEVNLSTMELARKYGLKYKVAYLYKKNGYRIIENPNHINQKDLLSQIKEKNKALLEEVVTLNINSIETVFHNLDEQKILKEALDNFNSYKGNDRFKINQKRFKFLNGKEIFFSDLVMLNRIFELKLSRNQKGELFALYKDKNIKFNPTMLFESHAGNFSFRDINQKYNDSNEEVKSVNSCSSLESFSPEVFKSGFFKEEDFSRRLSGSRAYEIYGPHERSLSHNNPTVFLSNNDSKARYFLGREKFIGTDKKINHETVRVTLLDNNNAAITDVIHGRKVILYTFPLISKEQYEQKKREIRDKFKEKKESEIDYSSYITVGGNELSDKLVPYLTTNYIHKNKSEADIDYAERVSRLSDLSYVLGNFRSFLSETGLAANNYSWAEQLVLADALTGVEQKDKIINFGKNFKRNGMRTFLSIEQGGKEMGDKILALGDSEKLPEEVAKKVFAKYGEIINTADNIENEIKKIFGDKDMPNKVLVSVKETLLKRGAKMLSDLGDKVLDPKFEVNEIEILKELDEIKEETLILGESYVGLYKEGIRVPIDEVTTTKETPTENLSENQKKELIKIYEKGRPKVTYESKEHLDFLKNEFEEELNNKDISVTEICFKNETIIIALIDKKDKDNLYIGGLTFVEEVKNAVIAEATMSHVLKKFKDKNIKALVDSRNPLLNMYLKRFGFRITKKLDSPEEIKDNGGEIYVEIEKLKEQEEEKSEFKIAA